VQNLPSGLLASIEKYTVEALNTTGTTVSSSSLSTIAFLTEININDKVAFVKDVFERKL
jgi:hypothetical protein